MTDDLVMRLRKGRLIQEAQSRVITIGEKTSIASTGETREMPHPDALEAAARIEALEGENRDLKDSVISFGGPWAVQYAKQCGLPDGHLHPTHFDILEAAGARMDAFTRAALAEDKSDG